MRLSSMKLLHGTQGNRTQGIQLIFIGLISIITYYLISNFYITYLPTLILIVYGIIRYFFKKNITTCSIAIGSGVLYYLFISFFKLGFLLLGGGVIVLGIYWLLLPTSHKKQN